MLYAHADRSATTGTATGPGTGLADGILDSLEAPLAALGSALGRRDAAALEQQVIALQAALAAALLRLRQTVRTADGHTARPRLTAASARLAAQRECVARECAVFERGLALLLPSPQPAGVYDTQGHAERAATHGSLCA